LRQRTIAVFAKKQLYSFGITSKSMVSFYLLTRDVRPSHIFFNDSRETQSRVPSSDSIFAYQDFLLLYTLQFCVSKVVEVVCLLGTALSPLLFCKAIIPS
jgi:hypothetical protein